MQEFEVKSDESYALCIFKGETINALPLNWLIWGNRAVFEPFVLTRFWFNCLSLNEFLIDKSAWLLCLEERCRKSWLGFLIVIPLGCTEDFNSCLRADIMPKNSRALTLILKVD